MAQNVKYLGIEKFKSGVELEQIININFTNESIENTEESNDYE